MVFQWRWCSVQSCVNYLFVFYVFVCVFCELSVGGNNWTCLLLDLILCYHDKMTSRVEKLNYCLHFPNPNSL